MKLTTNEVMQRYQALLEISNNKTSGRIAMAIMCNLKALEDTYKTVEQTLEDTKIKYADKDEESKPIIVNNNYQISDENLKLLKDTKRLNSRNLKYQNQQKYLQMHLITVKT